MSEAIVGLIGVLVGGALTAGVEYFRRRAVDRAACRAAARVLLDTFGSVVTECSRDTLWPELLEKAIQRLEVGWDEQRSALAQIYIDDWQAVASAVYVAEQLRQKVERKREAGEPRSRAPLDDFEYAEHFTQTRELLIRYC